MIDPAVDAARIRAFFVHPDMARRGLARLLYQECARAAHAKGVTRLELVATMPGVPLYLALGFAAREPVTVTLSGVGDIPFLRMGREI